MKNTILLSLLLSSLINFAQQPNFPEWGVFSDYEKNLTVYEKDSSAHAVVLSEIGYSYVSNKENIAQIITKHYVRIKILDREGFYFADIKLPLTSTKFDTKIKASTTNFTNNKAEITYVEKSNVYTKSIDDYWVEKTFTFPNLKVGSIIEYSFEEDSFNFESFNNGWIFQSEIPKIRSSFFVKIPEYWQYHMSSVGIDNPKYKQEGLIKKCFSFAYRKYNCIYFEIEQTNIPAFVKEDFMTSPKNYLKQIIFSRKETEFNNHIKKKYITNWQELDKIVLENSTIGNRYNKTNFFRRKLPEDIFKEENLLNRAKNVYQFIQQHYKYSPSTDNYNTRTAFTSKIAKMSDINISLINALIAADIPADIALLSTRSNGVATKLYPTTKDFNYLVAHIKINGVDYFLDATDRNLPFGLLPYKCLNNDIRIFKEKSESYWYQYIPIDNNENIVYTIGDILEDGTISMKTRILYNGYSSYLKRKTIKKISIDDYKKEKEDEFANFEIAEHNIQNINNIEKPLIETYLFNYESDYLNNKKIFIKPFIVKDFNENPFRLKERKYPINTGFKRKFKYNITFNIPDGYSIKSIPKNRKIVLPDDGGKLLYLIKQGNNKININFIFSLDKIIYSPQEYNNLKELFSQLIVAQNEMIILEKE